ncbi:MAG: hypothetical protein AB2L09_03285 [Coriobacteriia bacterium]
MSNTRECSVLFDTISLAEAESFTSLPSAVRVAGHEAIRFRGSEAEEPLDCVVDCVPPGGVSVASDVGATDDEALGVGNEGGGTSACAEGTEVKTTEVRKVRARISERKRLIVPRNIFMRITPLP